MDAPTGDLTLVFTDVQGSTRLWEESHEAMEFALQLHNALIREQVERHGGYEVKTEGDAFMVSFRAPDVAARWCVDVQRALSKAPWPAALLELPGASVEGSLRGLRVRMGIHHGRPSCRPDPLTGRMDYFGPMVNRAARVSSAAHGGQVLLSQSAHHPMDGCVLEDHGSHQLKGLSRPERLWELRVPDLQDRRHPPLRTLNRMRTNLGPDPAGFIGRRRDLKRLDELVRVPGGPVTVLGSAGTGKTRLVRHYGATLEGREVWFCGLADATSLADVLRAVAQTLAVPGQARLDSLIERVANALLARGSTVLILDNVEQVQGVLAAPLTTWLRKAPELTVVVTSRERLRVVGERVLSLAPLPAAESRSLFIERVRDVFAGFVPSSADEVHIAAILQELDHVPLAIELAAARVRVLGLAGLRQRLGQRMRVLRDRNRDGPRRQSTLHDAIHWSWQLLGSEEQRGLAWLSVFRGTFDYQAADDVLGAGDLDALELLDALRDKSLVRSLLEDGELTPRFALFLSIRDFAETELRGLGEHEAAMAAMVAWAAGEALALVEDDWRDASDRSDHIQRHLLSFQVAAEHATGADQLALDRVVLIAAVLNGPPSLAEASAARVLARVETLPAATRLSISADLISLGDRGVGDAEATIVAGLQRDLETLPTQEKTRALNLLARVSRAHADFETAASFTDRALTVIGDEPCVARVMAVMGRALYDWEMGRREEAERGFRNSAEQARRIGHLGAEALSMANLASLLSERGLLDESTEAFRSALALMQARGHAWNASMIASNMGLHLLINGADPAEALVQLETAWLEAQRIGNHFSATMVMGTMALAHMMQGDPEAAHTLLLEAISNAMDANTRSIHLALDAACLGRLGQLDDADRTLEEARQAFRESSSQYGRELFELVRCSLELDRGPTVTEAARTRILRILDGLPDDEMTSGARIIRRDLLQRLG